MSGFTNVTGFADPISPNGFMGLLQTASFRGIPFKCTAVGIRKGRKVAVHDYPFRDGAWAEDMGRAPRIFSVVGRLIGDLAPAMQVALDTALETPGPGLFIHPTVGAQMVSVLSGGTSVRRDAMRIIDVALELIEQGQQSLITTEIATAVSVIAAANLCIPAAGAALGAGAGVVAEAGNAPVSEAVAVSAAFGGVCTTASADPAGVVNMAAGLLPASSSQNYGRYSAGRTGKALPADTTIASMQAAVVSQRAAVASAVAAVASSAATFSVSSAATVAINLAALIEAVRATMTDPADQVRVMLNLAGFGYLDSAGGTGISGDMATVRNGVATACRRLAVVSLARAASVYLPVSYQDAQALMTLVTAALDVEITAAGDAGDDNVYGTLRALRAAVVTDLSARGTTLPQVQTQTFGKPLPALVVAQILYRDATRADEITQQAAPRHPAFCPIIMQVLAT